MSNCSRWRQTNRHEPLGCASRPKIGLARGRPTLARYPARNPILSFPLKSSIILTEGQELCVAVPWCTCG